ncbi:MAG: SCO family protein [Bacteroidia bacterium]|nr:SCO family protein [Bacteroidia bacterium]
MNNFTEKIFLLVVSLLLAFAGASCNSQPPQKYDPNKPLPVIGPSKRVDGKVLTHQIEPFSFVDQDSNIVTEKSFEGKLFVADFFFSTCPDICPKMSQQMVRVHDEFLKDERVAILSHSLDPAYDTPKVLKEYATALGVETQKWHMVTGYERSEINKFGQSNYLVTAMEDSNAPKGILHGGNFVLVDKNRNIRGMYDGTIAEEVDMLIHDIKRLLNEEY